MVLPSVRSGVQALHQRSGWGKQQGPGLKLNYVAFIQLELGQACRRWAQWRQPHDYTMNIIATRRLVMATRDHVIGPGSKVGLLDLMTRRNAMFEAAMKGFPKVNKS